MSRQQSHPHARFCDIVGSPRANVRPGATNHVEIYVLRVPPVALDKVPRDTRAEPARLKPRSSPAARPSRRAMLHVGVRFVCVHGTDATLLLACKGLTRRHCRSQTLFQRAAC